MGHQLSNLTWTPHSRPGWRSCVCQTLWTDQWRSWSPKNSQIKFLKIYLITWCNQNSIDKPGGWFASCSWCSPASCCSFPPPSCLHRFNVFVTDEFGSIFPFLFCSCTKTREKNNLHPPCKFYALPFFAKLFFIWHRYRVPYLMNL